MTYTEILLRPSYRNTAPKLRPPVLETTGKVLLCAIQIDDAGTIKQIAPSHLAAALHLDWHTFVTTVLALDPESAESETLDDRLFRTGADPVEAADIAGRFQLHIQDRAEARVAAILAA